MVNEGAAIVPVNIFLCVLPVADKFTEKRCRYLMAGNYRKQGSFKIIQINEKQSNICRVSVRTTREREDQNDKETLRGAIK